MAWVPPIFTDSFNKYLVNTYHMSGILQGPGDTVVNHYHQHQIVHLPRPVLPH